MNCNVQLVSSVDQPTVELALHWFLTRTQVHAEVEQKWVPLLGKWKSSFPYMFPANYHVLDFLDRDIIALVAQVIPIYAVSHLFEGLAVSILQ